MTSSSKRRSVQRAPGQSSDRLSTKSSSKAAAAEDTGLKAHSRTRTESSSLRDLDASSGIPSSDESTDYLSPPASDYGDFETIDIPGVSGQSNTAPLDEITDSHRTVPVESFEQLNMGANSQEPDLSEPADMGLGGVDMDIDSNVQSQPLSHELPTTPAQDTTEHSSQGNTNYFVVPTPVPTATGIVADAFAAEPQLPYAVGLMLAPDRPHVSVVTLEKSFPKEDDSELKRIRMLSAFKGNSKIQNLSLCDPSTLSLLEQRYLKHNTKDNLSLFFLTGIVKYTNLLDDSQNSRQIGFNPIANGWYRALAVLGYVYQVTTMYFASYQGSITLSTKTRNASSSSVSQPEGLTKFDGDSTTVSPSEIWSLNYDDDVPIFDGRYRLNFNNLRECPMYRRELQPGAAIAPIFTVHAYHPYGAQLTKHNVQKNDLVISFNIRALVYVKEPHPSYTHKQQVNARQEALGVIFPPTRGDIEAKEEVANSSNGGNNDDIFGGERMETDLAAII